LRRVSTVFRGSSAFKAQNTPCQGLRNALRLVLVAAASSKLRGGPQRGVTLGACALKRALSVRARFGVSFGVCGHAAQQFCEQRKRIHS
jgi:hypothetical protein